MIFGIIRWCIGIALFVIFFFALKNKKRHINHGKKRIIISAVFAVLITTVIFFIPFENLFVHFKTPESAYCYFQTGTPKYTVYGKNSAIIIADDRESENISVISKADKVGSWKISLGYNTKIVSQSFHGGNSAVVFKHKPTGDCYIFVYANDLQSSVKDEQGTKFVEISNESTPVKEYVAYLANFEKNYTVNVNGDVLVFN